MTREQIQVVESTWRQVAEIKEQAAELFYGKLFELGLHALSHNPRTKHQRRMAMKSYIPLENQTARRLLRLACATALAVVFAVSLPQPTYADNLTPPPVPANIQVPAGNKVFLKGHAVGTQNYICLLSGWTLFGPQATLFTDQDTQIITHFLSPNPDQGGMSFPTWQHSQDTSSVWAKRIPRADSPGAPGAIPWLLLEVVGAEEGPTGGHKLTETTFIQRLNTSGGVAPSTACTEVGKTEFVSYTADYFFYKATNRH